MYNSYTCGIQSSAVKKYEMYFANTHFHKNILFRYTFTVLIYPYFHGQTEKHTTTVCTKLKRAHKQPKTHTLCVVTQQRAATQQRDPSTPVDKHALYIIYHFQTLLKHKSLRHITLTLSTCTLYQCKSFLKCTRYYIKSIYTKLLRASLKCHTQYTILQLLDEACIYSTNQ